MEGGLGGPDLRLAEDDRCGRGVSFCGSMIFEGAGWRQFKIIVFFLDIRPGITAFEALFPHQPSEKVCVCVC